ncbi:DNA-directed RNA polymerase sigma-70 factor [Sphaerisporangium siamense]|uniref:RNA polymerase sigma-70 factor (ECF subfamily) n=1 Tax=Sphaerisporangium siamense TaxID=795645 RepID=A0A7W7DAX5_9ACTN|nr:sigma-70 family RNA polymerase sigma factor [Sphaerisporangium siamense]MBB4703204.1 RNA polymerase sigma-70 factor (ECF subfamily) [Sphaerisporangium siamense]GII89225.1 DNA-directed RNA polymerase sigma-70 factor [Sphaerisporangium siamense]
MPVTNAPGDPAELLERHRSGLTGFCYRMLGSAFEAEDAVQETLVRAWKAFDRYDEHRASPKSWLYAIAANVCTDMLRGARRRALAVDLGPACELGTPLGPPLPWRAFVQPVPDDRVLPSGDPAELAVARETIRLAFVAALQHLPPRQRAVLILRDVLRWTAAEVAGLLGVTVASVNSALQRARATLKERGPGPGEPFAPLDAAQRALLARYADAFERYDVEGMVALLHEDATMQMPPFRWWLRGRSAIRAALLGADGYCHGSRLVPVAANGSPAFAQYTPQEGVLAPWGLLILDVRGGRIAGVTTFLDAEALFPLFGLPARPGGR